MMAMIKVSTLWNGLARSVKNFPVPWKKSIKAEKNEMSVSMPHAEASGLSDQTTACKGLDTEALQATWPPPLNFRWRNLPDRLLSAHSRLRWWP
jgi:hypothetical protein